jgi:hypothetical protein
MLEARGVCLPHWPRLATRLKFDNAHTSTPSATTGRASKYASQPIGSEVRRHKPRHLADAHDDQPQYVSVGTAEAVCSPSQELEATITLTGENGCRVINLKNVRCPKTVRIWTLWWVGSDVDGWCTRLRWRPRYDRLGS